MPRYQEAIRYRENCPKHEVIEFGILLQDFKLQEGISNFTGSQTFQNESPFLEWHSWWDPSEVMP